MSISFIQQSRYYLTEEYPTKLRLALAALPDDVIWRRANESSNSIGNLIVHLAGNVREWIVCGIGGAPSTRNRALEFSRRDGPGAEEVLAQLDHSIRDADRVLAALDPFDLDRACTIQGRQTTALTAVYHVVEHFAMHSGQIILLAKAYAPGTIRFYDDRGDLAIPLWGGTEGMGAESPPSR
ncbi:MAG: DUF1572 family protein [Gemmatimonadaceae bacterium]|nr:DUF1572 family protein [Gemmatimonadaceae bacterium]